MTRLTAGALICLLVFTACNLTPDKAMPQGWRSPVGSEISDDWRKKDVNRYLIIVGDFNGDGLADTAKILVRADGLAFGLFVFVSQSDGAFTTHLLEENRDMRLMRGMGIALASAGVYKTACGKGYWECNSDETAEISLAHDAINYFKNESANSIFYWDGKAHSFKRIWISD